MRSARSSIGTATILIISAAGLLAGVLLRVGADCDRVGLVFYALGGYLIGRGLARVQRS